MLHFLICTSKVTFYMLHVACNMFDFACYILHATFYNPTFHVKFHILFQM